jgi:DNA-damage-inducible protein J
MSKTATARARIEPEVKEQAEKILSDCGLSASQAISLFYRRVILERGIPFPIKSFNEETRRVLKNSEKGIEVEQFDSAEALFEDLRI